MKKGLFTVSTLLFPVLLAAQPLGLIPTVNDARARGMGHTEIMNTAGSNAIFVNPANLGLITEKTLMGGGRVYFGSYEEDYMEVLDYTNFDAKWEPHLKFTHLTFAMPIQPTGSKTKITLGIGYNTHFDFGSIFSMEYSIPGYNLLDNSTVEQHGGLNTISPALVFNFNDKFFSDWL